MIMCRLLKSCLLLALLATGTVSAAPAQTLRVMSYNIHHGEGTDGKVDLERIARLILQEKADLVGLQELDKGVDRTKRRDLPAELAKLTGMHVYFKQNRPYGGGEYGNALLSRFPLLSTTNILYSIPNPTEQRGLQIVTVEANGLPLTFMNTHLDFRPDDGERRICVEEIKKFVTAHPQDAIVLTGDFNTGPDTVVHTNMQTFMQDAWLQVGQGPGLTYSSSAPSARIDYIWVGTNQLVKPIKMHVPESQASDHLPLVGEFQLLSSPRKKK